ncbi:MAG: MFS transporter [Streptosporangiaceae bacterium]
MPASRVAESANHPRRSPRGLAAGSLFAFAVLGLPDGMLGVAWPVLRHDFGQPLASLGELLLASVAGYLTVTTLAGSALRRTGTVTILIASAIIAAIATAGFTATRWWLALVLASVLLGAAGGGLDAGLNTAIALAGRTRLMNLIHATFGIGAAIGPLLVTAALATTTSWRGAYGVLFLLEVCLVGVWTSLRTRFPALPDQHQHDQHQHDQHQHDQHQHDQHQHDQHQARDAGPRQRPARDPAQAVLIGLSLAAFFCYAGVEIGTASWSASFLRGPDQLTPTLAGLAVFGYWAGLAAGRLLTAALGSRVSARTAAVAGTIGTIAGAGGVWANPGPAIAVTALVITGLSLGPIFPALMNLTPGRLGSRTAVDAVGWQLAASGIGGAGLSALIGVVLQQTGLTSLGPCLLLLAVLLAVLNLLLERRAIAVSR